MLAVSEYLRKVSPLSEPYIVCTLVGKYSLKYRNGRLSKITQWDFVDVLFDAPSLSTSGIYPSDS